MLNYPGQAPIYLYAGVCDMRKSFGSPGEAWRFQRVRFPPGQGMEPSHPESSLGLMEATT